MLSVSQLTRCFGHFTAVDAVNFTIDKGSIVGLLGHNGAGKTTVMKMISGFLEPTRGSIVLNGEDLLQDPKKIHRVLGYLPENSPLYPELKVFDYLNFIASVRGIPKPERPRQVKSALEATDVLDRAFSPIQSLSRGLKQRVGVAQAILGEPDVVILDEPTNGLDPEQTLHMRDLIKRLGERATVLLSTHIMQEVEAICDQVLIMRNGKLIVNDSLAALQSNHHLKIATSAARGELEKIIDGVGQAASIKLLDSVEEDGKKRIYKAQLDRSLPQSQADEIISKLASALIAANHGIYQLATEKRDLETIFKEVGEGVEVVDHAA